MSIGEVELNMALTSYVVIAFYKVLKSNMLSGDSQTLASNALAAGRNYLEIHLSSVSDPFELAITAYALQVAGSSKRIYAFRSLKNLIRGCILFFPLSGFFLSYALCFLLNLQTSVALFYLFSTIIIYVLYYENQHLGIFKLCKKI